MVLLLLMLCVASSLRAQEPGAEASEHSVGVPPYVQPPLAWIRAVFGYGGNAGLNGSAPSTVLGDISYQAGRSLITAGFIVGQNVTSDVPYHTYTEVDLMYGIAFESTVPHYKDPSDNFHASLSAGISADSYSERWRPYGPRMIPDFYPPTMYQYSIGLPIQFQAIYEPLRMFGVGLGLGALLFYNISAFTPSYGGAAVVEASY